VSLARVLLGKLRLPPRVGWPDHVIGLAVAFGYVLWLLATARSLGFPRDEGFYFHAGRDYIRWWDLFWHNRAQAIASLDGTWGENHEHPSLMKSLFGLSWQLLYQDHHVFKDASDAFRLPGMVMSGIALWVTYLFGARAYGRRAGLVAALLLALMPRVFFHAHLACFDIPIMTMWTWCLYVYWRSVRGGLFWAVAAGVMYGLTLDTKHNAWILPLVVVPHALFVHGRGVFRRLRVGHVSIPASLVAMATIGPLVFYALWPWLWNDTFNRLGEYLAFHLHHEYYNIEFLGKNYLGPPSPPSYVPVMIAATVPTITLVLFGVGAFDRLKEGYKRLHAWVREQVQGMQHAAPPKVVEDRLETDLLFALAFAAPLAPFFLPKTPIFGGTKHWLPAYPFLAIIAGRGFSLVSAAMRRALHGWSTARLHLAEVGLGALCTLGPLAITAHSHPFGLSSYVPLVGGTAGGADLGLNRQFWGFTTESAGPWLAANAPRGASVYLHDTAWDSWAEMIAEDRVRSDLRGAGSPGEADFALVHHELHMNEVDYQIWVAYGTDAPAYIVTHDGVPIVSIYRRR
jgi:hypothetical protein